MMISVKKVFISSNSRIICLPCPLPRGRFLIQESAVGGLSYYMKKYRPTISADLYLNLLFEGSGKFPDHVRFFREVRYVWTPSYNNFFF